MFSYLFEQILIYRVMIINIMIILVLFLLNYCEPAYKCYIINDTSNEVLFSISPSIQNYTYGDNKEKLLRNNISMSDTIFKCKIHPRDTLNLIAHLGSSGPIFNKFPFHYTKFVILDDTISILTKEKFLNALNLEKRVFIVDEYSIRISNLIKR
jgi:hypothetical protein